MRFNPKANIGGGRISGGGGGGGGGLGGLGGGRGLPIPGGLGIKGTILLIVIYFVIQMCSGGGLPGSGIPGVPGGDSGQSSTEDGTYDNCKTGEDANKDADCARQAVVLSIEQFWETQFKDGQFKPAPVRTFGGQVQTGCGAANSGMGPFYCPADFTIYEDPTFYEQVFEGQLGGNNGAFVEPYVLGHEYGHHIQNITGQMKNVRTQQGENSDAVKLELQADCYAGLWTHHAETVPNDDGVVIIEDLTDEDIKTAIEAAATVGDDHIQKTTQGRVDETQWTHGSSEQRMEWFKRGYDGGTFKACNIWG
ncbi:KPN_02809 family neutral zinc metallopeptidase [Nocardioides sp.]|uniref:KPN_02809 family neutral zinc metallopeptidase n=1 Tax=Nocardioides sp. TaxID=35761 RepID=UPI002B9A5D22|nr:neutral zinc metallopeptidase [Nocardioides sp.]HSX66691.1 neutral zinc metallopeptidase [Nocardioides sp.]